MSDFYKVGGSLRYGHPTYIQRQADRDIYAALKQQEFCYVLNSRQMGKSSLRVSTMKILVQEGFKCVVLDLGVLGRFVSAEQWYGGFVAELWRKLRLSQGIDDDLHWWRSHQELSPVQRLRRFIADILLVRCPGEIIIFLDEIDNIINFDFRDEFLSLIRNCYEQRSEDSKYYRLTFCLLGVATPSSLRIDKQLSPFNIGRAIQLTGFTLKEAEPLITGLRKRYEQPEKILAEVLTWTKGQPFLTQKLCHLIVKSPYQDLNLSQLIQEKIVHSWEIQDEPEHLKTIRDRLLNNRQDKARLLTLYQQILQNPGLKLDGSEEQVELRLSGLVSRQADKLVVSNPIYQQVFNLSWVEGQLAAISPYQNAIAAWLKSGGRDNSRLLRGEALIEGQVWAKKHSISHSEKEFLQASEILAAKEKIQAELAQQAEVTQKKLAQKKKLLRWQRLFILFSLGMISGFYFQSRQANLNNIKTLIQSSTALSASQQKLDALITAIAAQQKIARSLKISPQLIQQADRSLQEIIYSIKEKNRLLGHRDRLYGVAVSADGQLMASAATDRQVFLWQKTPQGWQLQHNLTGHDGWVVDVAISADGKTIASASLDRTVKLWSPEGKLLNTLRHPATVTSVVIDDERLITGSDNGKIYIWQQSKIVQTLTGHTAAIQALTLTPNGKIVSASEDKTLKIWNLQGKAIATLAGHTEGVRTVTTTKDGQKIISGSRDKTLKIWNLQGKAIATLAGHTAPIYGVAINPQNNRIISASGDQTLKIWSENGTEIATLQGHTNRVWDVALTPSSQIISASWDKTLRIWQPDNNLAQTLSAHQDVVIALDYQGDLIASASDDKTVKLWNRKGTLLKTLRQHSAEVYDVAIGKRLIASVGADRTLQIWHRDNQNVITIPAHQAPIWTVEVTADDQHILTAGDDLALKIWDFRGNLQHTFHGHNQKIWDLAISPDNQYLVSASEDNTLKIWDFMGNLKHTLIGHQDAVRTVTTNGKQIISAGEDRTIKVWDLAGQLLETLKGHNATIKAISLSPQGEYLASVDDQGMIILWQREGETWQRLQTFQGSDNSLWSVVFSPDGQVLVTAGEDTKVIFWNLSTMLQLNPLKYACTWVKEYLAHGATITASDPQLCD